MGRGPGNAKTEYLAIELEGSRNAEPDLTTLLALIRSHFKPMQERCGWGSNAFYYLAGKYGIHPTYVQEMLADARYAEEDILAAIEHLRRPGGHKYSQAALDETLNFYSGEAKGSWRPAETMAGRDVLILGNGPGAAAHKPALENWIRTQKPLVIALNTQSPVSSELIDLRAACHPLRLLADIEAHRSLPQPLITPYSMLPAAVRSRLAEHKIKDFGLSVQPGRFAFSDTHVAAPSSIVIAYTLAIAASGKATRILLAGFDGYAAGDPRNAEMQNILSAFAAAENTPSIVSITPSRYSVTQSSVYASF
jgi:4-hydroxy 2-oxovalerate aldolase